MTQHSNAIVVAGDHFAALAPLVERAQEYVVSGSAPATRRAYERDASRFERWCVETQLASLPADARTVVLYLTGLAERGRKASTIERALAGISAWHRSHGHAPPSAHPAVIALIGGIRRRLGTTPKRKAPVVGDTLSRMVATLRTDVAGLRDRALLTLGFSGAFRRSELVALDIADVQFVHEGAIVTLRRSKTDQEGRGNTKGIPFAGDPALCPVRALRAWLDAVSLDAGPLFRAVDRHANVARTRMADRSVARIVQRTAAAAGVDADVAGHSLRAGFVTTAAAKGKSLDAIMRQTGHKSERVARTYIRHATLFTDNGAAGLV